MSRDAYKDTEWIEEVRKADNAIWLDTKMVAKDKYSVPGPIVYYFRKLYFTIHTSNPIGVIAVEYDGNALNRYINSLSLYEEQTIAVINKDEQILLQNRKADLSPLMREKKIEQIGTFAYYDTSMDGKKYTVSRLQSQYIQDLEYVSAVPTENILYSSSQLPEFFCF